MVSAEIAAYMAGLIDGEGALIIEYNNNLRVRPSFYPRITMSQKDKRLLDWVVRHFGGTINEHPTNGCYQWGCPVDRILPLLEACMPYLIIKKRKATIMIALRLSILEWKKKRYQSGIESDPSIPAEIFEYRLSLYKEFKRQDPEAIISSLAGATTERIDSFKKIRNDAQRSIYKEMRQSELQLKSENLENSTEMLESHIKNVE